MTWNEKATYNILQDIIVTQILGNCWVSKTSDSQDNAS